MMEEIPASDASNASKVQDYVRHKKDKTDRMLRRCKIIWKTRQNKTDETQQYRTMIPASDASNASEERDYWKTRQDKTDETQHTTSRRPRPGVHTLCEPAQSKCMWPFRKSHFVQEFTGTMPQAEIATHTLREPAQSKCT